jgi:hypothetical protein
MVSRKDIAIVLECARKSGESVIAWNVVNWLVETIIS